MGAGEKRKGWWSVAVSASAHRHRLVPVRLADSFVKVSSELLISVLEYGSGKVSPLREPLFHRGLRTTPATASPAPKEKPSLVDGELHLPATLDRNLCLTVSGVVSGLLFRCLLRYLGLVCQLLPPLVELQSGSQPSPSMPARATSVRA
ncbi:Uncharacterized protein Rs2_44818 [Raphanus sativus]|nr:Uncharacterized protein Rs2_44818 [Raphanus sativus]